jgi:hypothetical protein
MDSKMRDGYGVCPVCNGTGQVELTEHEKTYSWNKDQTHRKCHNCGGQYMYSSAKGEVRLNTDGVPCTHNYTSTNDGRCLTGYTCMHCGDRYQIDSGD